MANKFLSREEYLDKQRQAIIEQSLENSRNRILPTVPLILRKSEKEWKENINNLIEATKNKLNLAIQYNHGKDKVDGWQNQLNRLNDELNKGYVEELCAGDSCIYTATDNYGKKYRISGNKSFRANPSKYGFKEINLNNIKPGDIIQDFSSRDNAPHHAITFIGYDDNNKALFNYSKGGSTEEDIVKNGHYPFIYDDDNNKVHLDGINNSKLQHTAAAYRFIGTEDDNKQWEEQYYKDRTNFHKQIAEELKQVPTLVLPNQVQRIKFGGMKQNKLFKLNGGMAIPLDKTNKLFYLSGAKHEQGGIDVTPELEAEGGEVIKVNPKSIKVVTAQKIMGGKSPAELVVDASSTGEQDKVFNKVFKYQEDFKDRHNLNDDGTKQKNNNSNRAFLGKIKNKISNFYWHTLRAPKDYSEEVATLRNGCTTTECAKWSNDQLQKAGLNIFGDAWTRSNNKGIKKIYSGYDISKRPKKYNKEDVINYTLDAADSLAKTLNINDLQQNDIVGLYFRNSPNIETAYEKGANGETQTHTGHVVIDEDGTPFIVHNVHGEIIKNKAEDLIGSRHPYGITSVYRKELGGQMKKQYKIGGTANVPSTGNKKKAYLGLIETINRLGQHFLYPSVTPSVVTANKPVNENVAKVGDFETAFNKKYPTPIINVPQIAIPSVNIKSKSVPVTKRTVDTTNTDKTKSTESTPVVENTTKSNTNYKPRLDIEFLNEIVNPDGSITNIRTGQTYFKDLNKIRRSPYSQLNLKTGQMEYAGYINPYGAEIQPAVYNNGPKGRQEREAKERLLNTGDWINIGTNAVGALTNLITGLATPNIRYARMKDAIPVIAPKINANVNTNAEESAIDEQYYNELNAIDENTANSQTALNRKRNAAARRAAAKVKVRSAAENTRRDLINKGNILKGEYDKFNIQRQDQIDAYNAQAEAAEFNANRTKVGDAITGFVGDLAQGAAGITNAIERRQTDRINTVLSYMGNPEVNPEKFGEGFNEVYKQLYGINPPKYISKRYNKKK